MEDDGPIGPPPNQEAGEIAQGLARAALSGIPVVGGPAAELLGLVVDPVLHRRREKWLEHLSRAVDDLRAYSIDIRTLEGNEALVTVILNATQAAARTHEEEKLLALQNAITNSALPFGPDEHVQLMFIRFVDEFTALHLRVLGFLYDPPSPLIGPLEIPIEEAIPDLEGQGELIHQIIRELVARGLVESVNFGPSEDGRRYKRLCTYMGDFFYEYISSPRDPNQLVDTTESSP